MAKERTGHSVESKKNKGSQWSHFSSPSPVSSADCLSGGLHRLWLL